MKKNNWAFLGLSLAIIGSAVSPAFSEEMDIRTKYDIPYIGSALGRLLDSTISFETEKERWDWAMSIFASETLRPQNERIFEQNVADSIQAIIAAPGRATDSLLLILKKATTIQNNTPIESLKSIKIRYTRKINLYEESRKGQFNDIIGSYAKVCMGYENDLGDSLILKVSTDGIETRALSKTLFFTPGYTADLQIVRQHSGERYGKQFVIKGPKGFRLSLLADEQTNPNTIDLGNLRDCLESVGAEIITYQAR